MNSETTKKYQKGYRTGRIFDRNLKFYFVLGMAAGAAITLSAFVIGVSL